MGWKIGNEDVPGWWWDNYGSQNGGISNGNNKNIIKR